MCYLLLLLSLFSTSCLGVSEGTVQKLSCSSNATLPDDLEKQYRDWLSEDNGLHPSFQLIPGVFSKIGKKDTESFGTRSTHKETVASGDRKCHKKMLNTRNLNDRSLCPWYFLLNYDQDRYPASLATVRCKCKHCYRQEQDGETGKRVDLPRCKRIPYRYKVLKQKYDANNNKLCNEKGEQIFVRTYETLHIGCTCVVPKRDIKAEQERYVSP